MVDRMLLGMAVMLAGTTVGTIRGILVNDSNYSRDRARYVATIPTALAVGMPDHQIASLNFDSATHRYVAAVEDPTAAEQNGAVKALAAPYNQRIGAQFNVIAENNHPRNVIVSGTWGMAFGAFCGLMVLAYGKGR